MNGLHAKIRGCGKFCVVFKPPTARWQCCHLIHSIVTMSTETGGKHKEQRPKKQYVALLTVSQHIES